MKTKYKNHEGESIFDYEEYDVFKTLYLFPDGTLNVVIDSVGERASKYIYEEIGKGKTGIWETLNIIEGDKQVLFYRYTTNHSSWSYFTADRPTVYYFSTFDNCIKTNENTIILHIDVID